MENVAYLGNGKKKESNFTHEEDLFLCRAWKGTSGDSIKGNDQSSITFWDRVGAEYASLIGSNYAPRVGKSLPQRWSRIRTAVTKFEAIFNKITDKHPSGSNPPDRISMAVLTYNNEVKETFRFLHCWTELRNSPKWNAEGITGHRPRNLVLYSQQLPTPEHVTLDDDDDESQVAVPMPLERPEGQKLAKQNAKKRKAKELDTSSSEVPKLMRDMHAEKLGLMNRQQEIVEEMLLIKREKRDAKIMLANPSVLTELGKQYLDIMQWKIFTKVNDNPPPSA